MVEKHIDIAIRIFHWCFVSLLICLFVSISLLDNEELHIFFGYLMLSFVVSRILWGFLKKGKGDSWGQYLHTPKEVFQYLSGLFKKNTNRIMQIPNPAGSYMAITMITLFVFISITGLVLEATFEFSGIALLIADNVSYNTAYLVEEVHIYAAYLIIGLSVIHIAGVVYSSKLYGINLPLAIITGRIKPFRRNYD